MSEELTAAEHIELLKKIDPKSVCVLEYDGSDSTKVQMQVGVVLEVVLDGMKHQTFFNESEKDRVAGFKQTYPDCTERPAYMIE